MRLSEKGLNLIKRYEGCRLTAYKPVPTEKYYTIGYGHYGIDVKPNMIITQEIAEILLLQDTEKFQNYVNEWEYIYHWTQNEFDALVSFTFNLGRGNLYQLLNYGARNKTEIAKKITAYNKAGGKVLNGLVKRRAEEYKLFIS